MDIGKLMNCIHQSGIPFTKQQVDVIISKLKVIKIKRQEILLNNGAICEDLYFINSGMIRTFFIHHKVDITTWVALPGNFTTSIYSFSKQMPSWLGLQAISSSELLLLSREGFFDLLHTMPPWKDFMVKLYNDYQVHQEQLTAFCLNIPPKERYQQLQLLFPNHFSSVPMKYLASMLHVQPETLSRIRKWYQVNHSNQITPNELDFLMKNGTD